MNRLKKQLILITMLCVGEVLHGASSSSSATSSCSPEATYVMYQEIQQSLKTISEATTGSERNAAENKLRATLTRLPELGTIDINFKFDQPVQQNSIARLVLFKAIDWKNSAHLSLYTEIIQPLLSYGLDLADEKKGRSLLCDLFTEAAWKTSIQASDVQPTLKFLETVLHCYQIKNGSGFAWINMRNSQNGKTILMSIIEKFLQTSILQTDKKTMRDYRNALIHLLLGYGASVETVTDKDGHKALHYAQDCPEVLEILTNCAKGRRVYPGPQHLLPELVKHSALSTDVSRLVIAYLPENPII